ncbi:MAG: glycosyltransferase family 2 protein [Baekduiaceae bacterium]
MVGDPKRVLQFADVPVPEVSVVITTARNADRLVQCLSAVHAEAETVPLEVIVVLNAAEPGHADALAAAVTGVRVVESAASLGFAGGVNLGARAALGRCIHVLHDDAVVEPGAIAALVGALDDHPEAAGAGSLLLDARTGDVQSAGPILWRNAITEERWRGPAPPPSAFTAVHPVDYCSSASLLVRADAWHAVGGCDEELHPGQYVDVDLAMRLRAAGHVTVLAPGSRVRHARGGTMRLALKRVAGRRNRERFVGRWANDLLAQEPYADDDGALARAQCATAARAAAVTAGPKASAPQDVPPEARAERERRALLRDLAYKTACQEELVRVSARADELQTEIERLHPELNRVHAAHAAEMAARQRGEAQCDDLAQQVAAQRDESAYLRQRAQVLDAILAGRWWRLRTRLGSPLSRSRQRE